MLTTPSQPTSGDVYTIRHVYQQWLVRFRQGDAAGVAAIYTEGGQLLPAYSAAISGRAAIQAFWQGCIDMGIYAMQRTPCEMDFLADTVNEVGTYCFLDRHSHVLDVGNYVVIWKWQQGQWQIQCDIWTSSLPTGV